VQGKILIKFVAASQVLIERLLYPSLDLPTYAQTSWTWTAQERKKEVQLSSHQVQLVNCSNSCLYIMAKKETLLPRPAGLCHPQVE
jgi:hypothetical protein